jgi:mono/diheme cytochrome c family protein
MGSPAQTPGYVAQIAGAQAQRGKIVAAATADSQAHIARPDLSRGADDVGAVIYASACAGCHRGPRAVPFGGIDLALSSGVSGPNADNLVNVVLNGLPAAAGSKSGIMPGFAATMTDAQVVALVNYLRAHFSDKGPWTGVEDSVRAARGGGLPAAAAAPGAAY